MAASILTNAQACNVFWRRCILANLRYWQDYLTQNLKDVTALDREWEGIIKAISFGLDLKEGWPLSYQLIIKFSDFMERRGYWSVWHTILSRALEAAPQAQDSTGEVTLSALSARLWQRQGNYKQMVVNYRRTIRLARRHGDHFNEGRACTNLGYFYVERGQWYRAEVLCCYALEIFDEIDNNHGRAHTENHLGVLFTWRGQWGKAERHLKKANSIWAAMEDPHGLMRSFTNLGVLYTKIRDVDQALFYSQKALEQARATGEELEIGKIYSNMGLAYSIRGDYDKAEEYSRQAETVFQRFSDLSGLTDVLENLGVISLMQQNWEEAIVYLEGALKGWRTLNNKHDEIKTIIYLIECELAKNNRQQVNSWLKEMDHQLKQYPQVRQYYQMQDKIEEIHRSLTEINTGQAATRRD